MLRALKFGVSVGIVVAVFETYKRRGQFGQEAWSSSIVAGATNSTTLGAVAAAAVAGLIFG